MSTETELLREALGAASNYIDALGGDSRSYRQALAQPGQPAPQGWKLVHCPITEEMHAAACKVLYRASGLDGMPQRMLDAMLAASPTPPQAEQAKAAKPLFAGLIAATPGAAEELKAVDAQADEVIRQYEKMQAKPGKPETERARLVAALWDAIEEYAAAGEAGEAWTGAMQEHAAYVLAAREKIEMELSVLLSADSKDAGEPVAEVVPVDGHAPNVASNRMVSLMGGVPPIGTKLYTRPQAADAQPLTDEQIRDEFNEQLRVMNEKDGTVFQPPGFAQGVKFAERARGITGKDNAS